MPVMAGKRSGGTMLWANGVRARPQAMKVTMVIAVIHHGSWTLGTHLPPRPKREEQPEQTGDEDERDDNESEPFSPVHRSARTQTTMTHAASSPMMANQITQLNHWPPLTGTPSAKPSPAPLRSTTRKSGTVG